MRKGYVEFDSSDDDNAPQARTDIASVVDLPRVRLRKPTVKLQAADTRSESGSESESDFSGTYSYSYSLFCG